jgi:hypothetical protein
VQFLFFCMFEYYNISALFLQCVCVHTCGLGESVKGAYLQVAGVGHVITPISSDM